MTDAPERSAVPWWLPALNAGVGGAVCIAMALRFAETTPTYFSMGLTLIAVVLISAGSSVQLQSNLMRLGIKLLAPAAKVVSEAADKDKDK